MSWLLAIITSNLHGSITHSNPKYPGRQTTVGDEVERLQEFRRSGGHTFWSDMLSLCKSSIFRPTTFASHRKLTDVYLLALAVEHSGRLATFDRAIPITAVVAAEPPHLACIGE